MKKKNNEKNLEETKQKKDSRRSDLKRDIVGYLLLVALGCLLIFRPDFGSAAVAAVVGWIAIVIGVITVFVCLLSWPVLGVPQLLTGIAAVAFGVFILLKPLMLASIFGVCVGIYLVLQGFGAIWESLALRKLGYRFSGSLIIGFVMLALGVVLIAAPMTSSRIVMMLIGISMVVCGGARLLLRAWAARKLSQPQEDPNIIDAEAN